MTDGQPADRIAELIASRGYEPVAVSDLPESVISGNAGAVPGSPQAVVGAAVPAPIEPQPPAPDTPSAPPPPQIPPQVIEHLRAQEAEKQRLAQQIQAMQFERLQQDEYAFAQSIAHLPPEQQDYLLNQREAQQREQLNAYLAQRVAELEGSQQMTHRQQQAAEEESAKKFLLFVKASEAGLDPEHPLVRNVLMQSVNLQDMEARIAGLKSLQGVGSPPAAAFANGGQRATAAAPRGPERGSGDMLGLIRSRDYTLTPNP